MKVPTELLENAIIIGLVLIGIVLAWIVGFVLGGGKFGKFLRRIEVTVDNSQLADFHNRMRQRLAELGFNATDISGQYLQSNVNQNPGAYVHAGTSKVLTVASDAPGDSHTKVCLSLEYADWIVADTGEGSYRDAVLDYLSGNSDEMKVVPNRSFMAVCSLTGGIIGWIVLFALPLMGWQKPFVPVLVVSITFVTIGVIAGVSILRKRGQATGMPWALTGIIISSLAIVADVLMNVIS